MWSPKSTTKSSGCRAARLFLGLAHVPMHFKLNLCNKCTFPPTVSFVRVRNVGVWWIGVVGRKLLVRVALIFVPQSRYHAVNRFVYVWRILDGNLPTIPRKVLLHSWLFYVFLDKKFSDKNFSSSWEPGKFTGNIPVPGPKPGSSPQILWYFNRILLCTRRF